MVSSFRVCRKSILETVYGHVFSSVSRSACWRRSGCSFLRLFECATKLVLETFRGTSFRVWPYGAYAGDILILERILAVCVGLHLGVCIGFHVECLHWMSPWVSALRFLLGISVGSCLGFRVGHTDNVHGMRVVCARGRALVPAGWDVVGWIRHPTGSAPDAMYK
jgi:hypothetical protein